MAATKEMNTFKKVAVNMGLNARFAKQNGSKHPKLIITDNTGMSKKFPVPSSCSDVKAFKAFENQIKHSGLIVSHPQPGANAPKDTSTKMCVKCKDHKPSEEFLDEVGNHRKRCETCTEQMRAKREKRQVKQAKQETTAQQVKRMSEVSLSNRIDTAVATIKMLDSLPEGVRDYFDINKWAQDNGYSDGSVDVMEMVEEARAWQKALEEVA